MANTTDIFAGQAGIRAVTLVLGERLDTRALERSGSGPLAASPPLLSLAPVSCAVLFRYGVVVLFGNAVDEAAYLARLKPLVSEPLAAPEREEARIVLRPDGEEQIEASGDICLREPSTERLQMVADILAKNAILAHDETRIAAAFDRIEPFASALRRTGTIGRHGRDLLREIGGVLLVQHKMVGGVEVLEKPELLWDHPALERLYARLETEYELRDRGRALDRKLELISRTAETMLGLLQSRSSLRVEWYIVLLIVAELLLTLYSRWAG